MRWAANRDANWDVAGLWGGAGPGPGGLGFFYAVFKVLERGRGKVWKAKDGK